MRIALAELTPVPGDLPANVGRAANVVAGARADLIVFPELFLSGYRIGDRFHSLALAPQDERLEPLRRACRSSASAAVFGAPWRGGRRGEVVNAVALLRPDGSEAVQGKRFLPTYGPFEEGATFSAVPSSAAVDLGPERLGPSICYDAFFPEVSRALALDGASLFVCVSAAPVTSSRLFDKVLPARAVENAVPLVYVNRVGVEDGVVFGGTSRALDARGELVTGIPVEGISLAREERVERVEVDLSEAARWRPFRPVLRDVAARSGHPPAPAVPTSGL